MLKVRNPQEVERVCPKEIGRIRHPDRQPAPLVVTRLKLDGLTPVHAVDDINELAVHFTPGNLLFAQDHIQVVGAIADIQLAHDAFKVMIGAESFARPGGKQTGRILPVVHTVVYEVIDIGYFDIG